MKSGLFWRILTGLAVVLAAVLYLWPTFAPERDGASAAQGRSMRDSALGRALSRIMPDARISLGLDLMGGIQLTLEVEAAKAVEASLAQMGEDLMSEAKSRGILISRPSPAGGNMLECFLATPSRKSDFDELIAKNFSQLHADAPQDAVDGRVKYRLGLTAEAQAYLMNLTVDQALATIRNRIDQFGVAEPDVRREQGDNRISIQLPGMKDPKRAIEIIGRTAHLEFRLVRDDVDANSRVFSRGVEALPMETRSGDERKLEEKIAVETQVALTGDHITNAVPRFDRDGSSFVSVSFDRRGSELFGRLTGDNINKRLAIILDGKVHSAPVIRDKIIGDASISGRFTPAEASDLAVVLRAGSLPAPVVVLEQNTVGPSLGQESIDMGIKAALVGGALVVLFMAVYYGWSGLLADVMLLLDVFLILAGMAAFGATLTLPGIAGIVLTLGMAVDANVLIFERIREEMRWGLTPVAAVEKGFSRAMLAITDSNLTTIIAAAILYEFGTGPIRGFAVTLTLGIVASMFTAIFLSRIVFDIWMGKPGRKLSI
jgi:preprotein translocase subunit SecD